MLSVQTLARRIRARLHDNDQITYADDDILDCINCGIRLIRRTIADTRPALLMSETEGTLEAGVKSITLKNRPTKIINVTAGDRIVKTEIFYTGKKIYHNFEKIWHNRNPICNKHVEHTYLERALHETEIAFIAPRRSTAVGTPREFFLTGTQTINFFPTPTAPTKYTIRTVDDIKELEWGDSSPLNTEFDDLLAEYATIRLSVGNEFDMTQESMITANIVQQIQRLLVPPPAGILTQGYWHEWAHSKAGGYW